MQITCDKEAEEEHKEVDNKDGCLEIGKLFAKLNGFLLHVNRQKTIGQKTETEN